MIFNSYTFVIFFLPAVLAVFWLIRGRTARTILLIAAGLAFYGYWNWRFIPLLVGSATVSFALALLISRLNRQSSRRLALSAGIIVHLGLLGFFKYAGFFLGNVGAAASALGLSFTAPMLSIILPLGISFSTFQAISYLVDVYRKTIPPERNPLRFLCYATLFPNMASGPILRYREIAPDLDQIGSPAIPAAIHRGVMLLIIGLAKKVIIADQLAETVDSLWGSPEMLTAAGAWLATIGYGLQLYFDFSGYSDMAVGIGSLFGLTIPQNFNSPYKALSPSDFWRRWHMTLGTWIKDYLYIPLGGSRRGLPRTATNLVLIMTAIGLWHGAAWTFVVWGAYHGALLAGYHLTKRWYDRLPALVRRAGTFALISIGWIPFRSESLAATKLMLAKLAGVWGPLPVSGWALIFITLALGITQFLPNSFQIHYSTTKRAAVAAALILVACLVYLNYKQATFLYYQF
ncbi:hypothetical protein A2704_04620 [Candidatus Kaiserbacteria bacterium RIFCSPHIGHO2_01_FULL_54_36b]|uniref:Acyltransferase n=1 Tax=Candidatus Kaiserbacteria bacterium RIFCSPHIGHO2_01_FULL_54_36b TaxID=1798483 RepID=A0A1F6CQP8_9BACT|nr:MAG: hypothetical protein A2704_04620 [Candidatus Kaiserbacteria bacterium RIFCSPHIGHO2_01_FULL_54_36b]